MYSIANERNMNITYLVGNVFKDFNIKKNDKYQIQESQIEFFNLVFHEIFFQQIHCSNQFLLHYT